MNNGLIYFNTKRTRETAIAQTRGNSAVVLNKLTGNGIEAKRSYTGSHPLGNFAKCAADEGVSFAHEFNFFECL